MEVQRKEGAIEMFPILTRVVNGLILPVHSPVISLPAAEETKKQTQSKRLKGSEEGQKDKMSEKRNRNCR